MKYSYIMLLAIACNFLHTSCKKDKQSEDQLPPATQTGAGTFGCKINGKVYVPKGSSGTGRPNPHIQYDSDLNGNPYLSIETFQYPTDINSGIFIGFMHLNNIGIFNLKDSFSFLVGASNMINTCGGLSNNSNIISKGGGQITKLDIVNHVISGTFDFKYKTQQCDTVYITDGRFDIKF